MNIQTYTNSLRAKDGLRLVEALIRAEYSPFPLNMMITINWHLFGWRQPVQPFIVEFLDRIGGLLRPLKVRLHYVWIIENPNSQLNTHILIHVPEGLGLARRFRRLLKLVAGRVPKGAIQTEAISSLGYLTRYLLKGLPEKVGDAIRLDVVDQGPVLGKRWGRSVSVGPNGGLPLISLYYASYTGARRRRDHLNHLRYELYQVVKGEELMEGFAEAEAQSRELDEYRRWHARFERDGAISAVEQTDSVSWG